MSNETKRDVVLQLAKENRDLRMYDPECIEPKELIEQDYQDWIREYAAALPDDLPVIPQAVGEYIKSNRTEPLGKVFWYLGCISVTLLDSTRSYIVNHTEDFASAWVLGVWRIEETGEIVKLEADK